MSIENQRFEQAGVTALASEDERVLDELIESQLDASPETCAAVADDEYAFVVAAWRADDAAIQSIRLGYRFRDETVRQIGTRNTHHVDESVETDAWARQFIAGREERALSVARALIESETQPSRRPFDGPFFGAGF